VPSVVGLRRSSRLGVSRQTANAIETSRDDPSLPLAFKFAEVFGLAIEQIFEPDQHGGEDTL
jgi:putative transcriptional regulator